MNTNKKMIIACAILLIVSFMVLAVYYIAWLPTEKELGNPIQQVQQAMNYSDFTEIMNKKPSTLKP